MAAEDRKTITKALKRFKLSEDAEKDIRKKSLSDLRFRAGEQWPDYALLSRKDPDNPRPTLTINRIPQFVRQVTNDARMNRPQIKVNATDDSTVETAEILEGLVRHIQTQSNADIAYDTACDNQVTMGFGYIRVITDYCYDDSFDQDILIKRVKNPFTVYFDPNAVEPDYSDAKWCFIVSDETVEGIKEQGGKGDYSDSTFSSIGDMAASWRAAESYRVAEYFEVVETDKNIHQHHDGSIIDDSQKAQLEAQDPDYKPLNSRVTKERKVIWRKITALEVLETKDWPGKYIPIVPVLGDDLDIDGKRELVGMVRYAKDPQRMYNFWTSSQAEMIALAPKSPFIMAEGQNEGYEGMWKTANTRAYSTLIYKPTTISGQPVSPPQRNMAEPPVRAMVEAIAQASEDLKNTTGIYDASLGARSNEISGKAINARQKEGDVSNFHYVDNLSRAIRAIGIIILDLIPKIYDAPRVSRIVHEDGEAEMVKLNQPTGKKDENGIDKIYDVTTGRYDVVVNVGPSYSTKRQEAADSMIQVSQAYPPLWQLAGDLLVKNMDWPGADKLAERLKKSIPPELQDAPEGQQQLPPQVMQKMQQSDQMIEQLTQALNAAHDQIDTKKQELESRERIAEQNNQTKIIVTEINNHMKQFTEELQHMREHNKLMLQDEAQQHAQEMAEQPPEPAEASEPA